MEKREKAIPEDIKNKIKEELIKKPSEKYSYPITQTQEIGWDLCQNLNTGKRKAKNTCPETKYADEYIARLKEEAFLQLIRV